MITWRKHMKIFKNYNKVSTRIHPVQPKRNQSWIFIGRTDVEAESPILWPPDAKNRLIGKDPDAGKDWRQEEKGTIADEMVGWHHGLNGHEFESTPGASDGQGALVCCSPWGHSQTRLSDWSELNWSTRVSTTQIQKYKTVPSFRSPLLLQPQSPHTSSSPPSSLPEPNTSFDTCGLHL